MIEPGKYRGVAVEWGLGRTNAGKPQVGVRFDLLDHPGESITWYGSFSEKAIDRTMESLRYCGWSCDSISALEGMGSQEVQLVVEHDTYEGKTTAKVAWVNRSNGLAMAAPMDAGDLEAFARSMRGAAVASRQKQPKPVAPKSTAPRQQYSTPMPDDSDIPPF